MEHIKLAMIVFTEIQPCSVLPLAKQILDVQMTGIQTKKCICPNLFIVQMVGVHHNKGKRPDFISDCYPN